MNFVAAGMFIASGIVNWPVAFAMAGGGLVGGYSGSRPAQRVGQVAVRRAVIGIGLGSFAWLLLRPLLASPCAPATGGEIGATDR